MASTVSEVRNPIMEGNKSMEVHSGDDDSGAEDVSPRKTEESSEDISEAEESSKVEERKPGQSSADESSEDKGSDGEEERASTEKVAQAKKESQAKVSSKAKKNGTNTNTTSALTSDLDTNAAEQVKSEGSRRERKQVERFSIAPVTTTEKAVVVPHGSGTKLGDIPFVADQINRHRADDLGYLHRFFYNKRGHTTEIKKNIRLFSGFDFDESSAEHQKKKGQLTKWKPNIIKQLCDVLGLMKKGTKEQVVERILEFCLVPTDSGAKPKVKAKKSLSSKKSSTPKSKSKPSSSSKSKSKSKPKAQKKSKKSDVSDEENVPDKDDKRRRSASDEEEDEPPRKRSREGPTRQAATGKRYVEVDESDSEPVVVAPRKKASPVKAKKPRKRSPSSDEMKSSESEAEAPETMSDDEKPKKSKSASKSSTKKPKSTPSAKPKPVVSKKPKSSDSESEQDDDGKGSSREEEEETSKSTDIPSDEKLKEFVVNMMKTANLKKVTMKTLMQDVATAFPKIDLTSKKSFIKDCVNEVLDSSTS